MRAIGFMHVVGYATAVALAIGGTATALPGTNTVDSGDIINGQVRTKDLAGSAVKSGKVLNNSLKGLDIMDGSVTGADISDGSLAGADVTDNSLGSADVTDNSLTGTDVLESSLNMAGAGCQVGLVHSFALVQGQAAIPNTYTTNFLQVPHNCSGGLVQVKRISAGEYNVKFTGDPAVLSTATVFGTGADWQISSIFDGSDQSIRVSVADSGGNPVDGWFQIMTY